MSKPTAGGRYIRHKDQTLERVSFTRPAGETPETATAADHAGAPPKPKPHHPPHAKTKGR